MLAFIFQKHQESNKTTETLNTRHQSHALSKAEYHQRPYFGHS